MKTEQHYYTTALSKS